MKKYEKELIDLYVCKIEVSSRKCRNEVADTLALLRGLVGLTNDEKNDKDHCPRKGKG